MTALLRVVLDQLAAPTRPDLAEASRELTRALISTAPSGCRVSGIVPAPGLDEGAVVGLADVLKLGLQRRELAASWQFGIAPGVGKGMIHSPTLMAPLVKHDRANETHQVVATLWDLRAWEASGEQVRGEIMWQRAMLKRAERHADALIVPTHAMADEVARLGGFGPRVRVIAGAAPEGYRVPNDSAGRMRALSLPSGAVVLSGGSGATDGLLDGFQAVRDAGVSADVVVLDCPEGSEPAVVDLAVAAGIAEHRVHVRGVLEPFDRAAVLGDAIAFVAPCGRSDWPWRVVEALTVGIPVVAADSAAHREVLVDAGVLAPADELGAALARAVGEDAQRLRVLSTDRAKAFSWREAADRVWALHAEL